MKKENEYIDMQYLNEVSPNQEFQKKIFKLFREEVYHFEANMMAALESGNFIELADLAHKAKSSVSIIGMKKEAEAMKRLQIDISEDKNSDSYSSTVTTFIQACRSALKEIEEIEKQF